MSQLTKLDIVRREDKTWRFTVHDLGSDPASLSARQDLTGATAFFAWRDTPSGASEIILDSTTTPLQVVIEADQTAGASTRGQFTVEVLGTDTLALSLGGKVGDVWVVLGSGKKRFLKKLKIELEREVVVVP